MNQRAVSIPIISKALTSMLGKSNNPILRDKIFLLRDPNHQNFSTEDTDSSHPQPTILQPSIHSSLWRIAQDRVRRPNTSKRGTSFFATDPDPRQLALNEEFQSLEPPAEDEFDDIELLDGDQYDGIGHDIGTGYVSETPDEPPHDGDTDFFFEDSSASTQITMDDISPPYESTQITWDEFSSICDHIPLDYSDAEMLL